MRPGGLQEREGPAHEALEGEEVSDGNCTGLLGLQSAFLKESTKRLHAPLEFMFVLLFFFHFNGDSKA